MSRIKSLGEILEDMWCADSSMPVSSFHILCEALYVDCSTDYYMGHVCISDRDEYGREISRPSLVGYDVTYYWFHDGSAVMVDECPAMRTYYVRYVPEG